MKKITKLTLIFLLLNFSFSILHSQVSINEDNAEPDASAMLDVSSTDKGVLIPRMDSTSRKSIIDPAAGLMVFDSTTNTFWYYTNSWQEITGDNLGNHTATQNIELNGNYISGDGEREGIFIDEEGNIGFGIEPNAQFEFSIFEDTSLVLDAAATSSNNQGGAASGRWQSYTALVSGTVAEVRLNFGSNATGTRELFIYEGEGTSGTILASTESDVTGGGEIIFNLEYDQITNQKYTIRLPNGLAWRFDNNASDNYPDGISSVNDAQDFTFKVFLTGLESQAVTLDSLGLTLDNYTLPLEDGQADQVLATDGNGQLDWQDLKVLDNLRVSTSSEGIENLGANYSALVCCTIDDPGTLWQSYKATADGTLTRVRLEFNTGSGNRTISIYAGQGVGGTLLGSATADISGSGFYTIFFDLSSENIIQQVDSVYTIQIDNRDRITIDSPGEYDDGICSFGSGTDIYFQTYYQPSTGTFEVNEEGVSINDYTFPTTDGINNQILSTDGNGNLNWVDENKQNLAFNTSNNTLSIDDGNSVNLSSINTDNQTLSLNGSTLSIEDGNSVDLSGLAPVGTIQMWPTETPPTGWLLCNGSTFNTSTYPDLNAVLGSNRVPDFRGRFPLGQYSNSDSQNLSGLTRRNIGDQAGAETHTLSINEMPAHSHSITFGERSKGGGGNNVTDLDLSGKTETTSSTGGNQAHNNMPPFYTINFIIKAE